MHENIVQFYKGILTVIKVFFKLLLVGHHVGTEVSPLNVISMQMKWTQLEKNMQNFFRHFT